MGRSLLALALAVFLATCAPAAPAPSPAAREGASGWAHPRNAARAGAPQFALPNSVYFRVLAYNPALFDAASANLHPIIPS